MKILQIGLGNNPGGVEAFVMNYFRELALQGICFDFICMYDRIAFEDEIRQLGGTVYYVPNVKRNYFGYIHSLKKIIREGHYTAVHVNMLSAANITPLRIAAERNSVKVIAHCHNSSVPGTLRRRMDDWNRPKIPKYADLFFACGEKAGRWMFGDDNFNSGKVQIIRNAIDVEKYSFSLENRKRVRAEFGLTDQFVIGHVGRFEVQKNHEGLIDIFAETMKKIPDAVLLLVGDGVLKSQIQEKAEKAGILDRIIFAGVRKDVAEILSAMDLFLFPSLFEGLPFTLVEAQANGLPCVISDTITSESVIFSDSVKKAALGAKPGIWADEILKLKGFQRRYQEVIRTGLEQAHFDIKKEADRLKLFYQE